MACASAADMSVDCLDVWAKELNENRNKILNIGVEAGENARLSFLILNPSNI